MTHHRYVIIGGGIAAGYAAQAMVEEAGYLDGECLILSADDRPPYERPPLSKDFLQNEEEVEDIWINEPEFYEENGIDLRLNTRVTGADFQAKQLFTENDTLGYDRLMIATGSRVRTLDVPGNDLANIFYLRRETDAIRIREAAESAQQAVVIGGGFIGMEVAASLRQSGVAVDMVYLDDHLGQPFFTPRMSKFFEQAFNERGVRLWANTSVDRFIGDDAVTGVRLNSGSELPADLVVPGIGVVPNVEIFEGSGLKIDDGILVNRFLETNMPDVFAAGDVAQYRDLLFHTVRRNEHWDNAYKMGRHVGKALLGERHLFEYVPFFFSDMFDYSYEFWGDARDADMVVHRGDVEGGSFSVWWLKNHQLQAAFIMDRPDEERELAQAWIKSNHEISADMLTNADTGNLNVGLVQPLEPAAA